MSSSPSRPIFDPVDTNFNPALNSRKDDVESPSLSDSNALARFEFEPGRSRDGTKVLMVEWEDDDKTRDIDADWELSWEGKKTVLPAKEQAGDEASINRLYFLLGPGVPVPTQVRLRKGTVTWRTNPLPAIFAPALGATAREEGKKGVLHTIWAKKRLQVLQSEIDLESKKNNEGIGLEMAIAEKEWIEANFGVVSKRSVVDVPGRGAMASAMDSMNSPSSPRSPGGSRLMDKLKGLKLDTQPNAGPAGSEGPSFIQNPLSPEGTDVAIGSFESFAELKDPSAAGKGSSEPSAQRRVAPQMPPESVRIQQQQQQGNIASLNAFANDSFGVSGTQPGVDDEDELFALPMSPRSPEMAKQPFSFRAQDTMKYVKGDNVTA
ncbi:hypothetical protein KC316_g3873 [Hortaea werneckii]|nr:hypothetical protein KC316_g3873 [Hortaea werneckii]